MPHRQANRRQIIAAIGLGATSLALPSALRAQGIGGLLGLGDLLGQASDNALDDLAQPGAFYNDEDIRIALPIGGRGAGGGGLLGRLGAGRLGDLGMLDGLTRTLNDAAGVAAGEAKPIFRAAINNLQLSDVPGILREDTGATQYLRRSSSDHLHARLMPLVDGALSELGAYDMLDSLTADYSWLSALGFNRARVNETVTDQGLDGIFKYIGNEERGLRENPLGAAGNLLGL